ncbi:hypothetical protein [Dietzia timorensis]|uniref:Uncharacterized protein n=1 Tax=Dietzia timorensis TaxID=499555 RepID=A0A173LGV5_9ACTN|nr:hypothetical protein [Dietzia timorensis]ANI91103.1 Hypothetical protein BJL86_0293 [Dietzia timorensis]
MEALSDLGFEAYIATGILGADVLRVPDHVLRERLAALRSMVSPLYQRDRRSQSRNIYQHRIVDTFISDLGYDLDEELDWFTEETETWAGGTSNDGDDEPGEFRVEHSSDPGEDAGIVYLATSVGGERWEFHKGDADPYPSVPHGHSAADRRIKLDPYRGWIYDRDGIQTSRLRRRHTIKLWNDEEFRVFAQQALDHYAERHPFFARQVRDERGVLRYRRLPRRR